jgi:hypothetical protein
MNLCSIQPLRCGAGVSQFETLSSESHFRTAFHTAGLPHLGGVLNLAISSLQCPQQIHPLLSHRNRNVI